MQAWLPEFEFWNPREERGDLQSFPLTSKHVLVHIYPQIHFMHMHTIKDEKLKLKLEIAELTHV